MTRPSQQDLRAETAELAHRFGCPLELEIVSVDRRYGDLA